VSEFDELTRTQLEGMVEFWRNNYHRWGDQVIKLEDALRAARTHVEELEDRVRELELQVDNENVWRQEADDRAEEARYYRRKCERLTNTQRAWWPLRGKKVEEK
jgi:chromosome segregation ATPase